MRALQFSQFGPPADVLKLEDLPTPKPGAGQVRVRMTHRSINPSDLLTVSGGYVQLPKLPSIPGGEGVGKIDALGDGVKGFQVGQRVIPLTGGTWCDYVIAPTFLLLPVAEQVSDQTAAQFVANPVSAWVMLEEELDLKEGDWVLQNAAGSTLGRIVLQMAKLKGYKTINFVRRRAQVEELLALGADSVICTEDADVLKQVMTLTNGKGVAGALDAVGGSTGALTLNCVAPGKTMIVYGLLSGQPTPINTGEMIGKGTTVRGFWLVQWLKSKEQGERAATFINLMQLMATGKIVPPVEAEYDLGDFQEAIAHAQKPGRQGKVLLTG